MAERVQVTMLYCGQGMANWIEYYGDDTQWANKTPAMIAMVDLGGDGIYSEFAPQYIAKRLADLKAKLGATPPIRTAIFSHQDSDHWSLIDKLLSELTKQKITDLTIGKIWCGGKLWKTGAEEAVERLRAATGSKTKVFPDNSTDYEGEDDDIASEGNCRLRLVIANGPCKLKSGGMMENGTSAVIAVELPPNSIILPGDATWETMNFINDTYEFEDQPLPCFAVSVPHHGSLRTSVRGYTKRKKVEKMGWQFVDTFVGNIMASQVGASAGFENTHEHPMIEIIKRFEKYATAKEAEHYLQVYSFTKQEWQKPKRETPVWTTTCYDKVTPPPPDPNAPVSKKRKIDPGDEFQVRYRHLVFTMVDTGMTSVQSIWLHPTSTPPPAPSVAAGPTPEERAAHEARSADAAE